MKRGDREKEIGEGEIERRRDSKKEKKNPRF